MTYNVFSGTLNPTHFTSLLLETVTKWSIKIKKKNFKKPISTVQVLHHEITESIDHRAKGKQHRRAEVTRILNI